MSFKVDKNQVRSKSEFSFLADTRLQNPVLTHRRRSAPGWTSTLEILAEPAGKVGDASC